MNAAFDNVCFKGSVLSQSARFVYLCLCKHADNTNQTCFPSLNRIAQIVGKSISTIKRAVRELIKYGAVERTSRFRKDGGQTSNLYKINECNLEEISDKCIIEQISLLEENLQEDNSFSVSEGDPAAQARGNESKEPETEIVTNQENNKNLFNTDELADKKCCNSNDRVGTDQNTVIEKMSIGKAALRSCTSKFRSWFKGISSKLHSLRPLRAFQNEPGGGHGRPARNLTN